MKTWNDYKEYIKNTDDAAAANDIREAEAVVGLIQTIIDRRTELGLSQRELAALCGLPQSSVARMESCKSKPNISTLIRVSRPLGLRLSFVSV